MGKNNGKKMKKTKDMKMRNIVDNTELTKPYVDAKGKIFWGRVLPFTEKKDGK